MIYITILDFTTAKVHFLTADPHPNVHQYIESLGYNMGSIQYMATTDAPSIEKEQNYNGVFTKQEMLQTLVSMDQSLNPEMYKGSELLDSLDFVDAAESQAEVLNLKTEFSLFAKENGLIETK